MTIIKKRPKTCQTIANIFFSNDYKFPLFCQIIVCVLIMAFIADIKVQKDKKKFSNLGWSTTHSQHKYRKRKSFGCVFKGMQTIWDKLSVMESKALPATTIARLNWTCLRDEKKSEIDVNEKKLIPFMLFDFHSSMASHLLHISSIFFCALMPFPVKPRSSAVCIRNCFPSSTLFCYRC